MKILYFIIFLSCINSSLIAQIGNIRFSFNCSDANTTDIYVSTSNGTANLAGFNGGFYFKSSETSFSSFDVSPATNLGWSTAGNFTSAVNNGSYSYGSQGPYDRYLQFQLIDANFQGTDFSTTPTLIAKVIFNSSTGTPNYGDYIFQISSIEVPAFQIFDNFFNTGDVLTLFPNEKLLQNTLPMTLLEFEAKRINQLTSFLNWTISSETNSSHFGIERSLNGYRWETIGRVAAAGNSRIERGYRFFDDQLPRFNSSSQEVYYRLKMCDRDGHYRYSEIRSVLFDRDEEFIQVYPNPATQKLYIDLSGIDHNGDEMELMVIGMDGSLVMRKTFKAEDLEPVSIDQLPANTYQIMVKHGDQIYQHRIVKVD